MNYNCGIIDDLLPLYVDGACSEESKAAVEAHLTSCEACRRELERMRAGTVVSETIKSAGRTTAANYANKVRRHRIKLAAGIVTISDCCLFAFIGIPDVKRYV